MMKMRMAQHTSVSPPTFLPAPGSPLGPTERALTAFVSDDDGAFNYAEPLAARRGFVLMQLVPRALDLEGTTNAGPLPLGLCNPITGERHIPPPACFSRYQLYGYAIVTAAVHHGAAHWLWVDSLGRRLALAPGDDHGLYKLSAELGTARVSLTKLHIRAGGKPFLIISRDGKLSVACVYLVHVLVRTQQDDGGGGDEGAPPPPAWLRTQMIQIPMVERGPYEGINMEVWRDFNRGSMLVMHRGGGVFILDLEKEVMEKVVDCFPSLFSNRRPLGCVPYEMGMVEFFVSCLGGLCRG